MCAKRPKYVGNDIDMWETSKVYRKWLRYVGNGLSVWEMSYICGKWLKYL